MTVVALAPDALHPNLRALLNYWQARIGPDGRLPAYADVDLMDLYRIATHLIVADIVGDIPHENYVWRYAGSTLRDIWGVELTGRSIHQSHDGDLAVDAIAIYREMARDRTHHYWLRPAGVFGADKSHIHYERVMVPFAGADGSCRHLMGVYAFYREKGGDSLTLDPIGTPDTGHVVTLNLPDLPTR